jgi:serine/threonine protein kinase
MPRAGKADPSPGPSCLDEIEILRFLEGTLSRTIRIHTREHIARCPLCADLTVWAAADIANGERNIGREGHPFIGQIPVGSRLARYEVLRRIGRGAMGEVYEGRDRLLGRSVALKLARVRDRTAPEAQARLLREAQALARLSHPNVVTIHDVGYVGHRVFIAMQLLEGQTADVWLRTRHPWRRVLDVFLAAGRGLAAAHAANIVHRDFKPQNVLVGGDGLVHLLDFSLARFASDRAPKIAERGLVSGTPSYMAPEQLRGEPGDARADQFAFCVALQEALSRPAARGAPARIRRALQRGLSPRARDRFASMERLLKSLSAGHC